MAEGLILSLRTGVMLGLKKNLTHAASTCRGDRHFSLKKNNSACATTEGKEGEGTRRSCLF